MEKFDVVGRSRGARNLPINIFVTDLINRIVQILRRDLRQVRISAQEAELMEPVEGGAAEQGHRKVERGHRWGSAKAEQGHRWSHQKKVGGATLLPIQNAHR